MFNRQLISEAWNITSNNRFLWLFPGIPIGLIVLMVFLLQKYTISPIINLYNEFLVSSKIDYSLIESLIIKIEEAFAILLPFIILIPLLIIIFFNGNIICVYEIAKKRKLSCYRSMRISLKYFIKSVILILISLILFGGIFHLSIITDVVFIKILLYLLLIIVLILLLLFAFHNIAIRDNAIMMSILISIRTSLKNLKDVIKFIIFLLFIYFIYISLIGFGILLITYINSLVGTLFIFILALLLIPLTTFVVSLWTLLFADLIKFAR